jgi:hypothetical protein
MGCGHSFGGDQDRAALYRRYLKIQGPIYICVYKDIVQPQVKD